MSKVFSADFRKGSYIDSVNKIVGTPTSLSKLIRTDKGTALARVVNHDGVTYTTGSKSLSKFTIVAWIKQITTDTGGRYGVAFIGNAQIIRRELSSVTYNNYFNSAVLGSISVPTSTSLNKWMQFVVTYDGVNVVSSVNNKQIVSSPSATTATLDFTSIVVGRGSDSTRYSDSDILKFDVYDDVISDKEIELDYRDLLNSQITEKPVRGFELVKPTDLSYLKDDKLGTNLTDNYDFMSWSSTGTAFVSKTANSFTTNAAGGGVSQGSLLTINKKYRMTIRGTTTSGFSVTNLSVSPTYATFSVGDFNSTIDFTATTAGSLYLRNTAAGTTTITHLSIQELTGLLAAYNFKRNGNTLVDISGNGNNFTLTSGILSRDGGLNFPLTNATIYPSMQFPAGSKTVCWRGTIFSIPGSYARIYGSSYIMFNSNLSILFYRASSDSIVQIGTGFTSAQFGKEFDFVFVQEGNNSQKLYINGVLVGTSTTETTSTQSISEISSTGTTAGNILFKDLRFYTRAFTEAEVKAYHNSWVKPEILEDWSGSAVGDVI